MYIVCGVSFRHADIPPGRLEEVISDKDVAMISRDHLIKWESLRPYLELSRPQEKGICNTYRDYEDQKRECLQMWKELKGNEATYGTLIRAAEEARNQQLADGVRAMLTNVAKGPSSTHCE